MGFLDSFKIKTKYGALAVTATPVIIVGGIYMALAYARKACTTKPVLTRSMSLGVVHGGKLALERLVALADAESLNDAEAKLKAQLEEEKPNFKTLQVTIAKLEMSGKETKAVEILEEKMNQARKEKKSHEEYEIGMLLVEMLIYKGDFHKARECHCLYDEKITDARRPLFLAVIGILEDSKQVQGKKEEAHEFWKKFNEIRDQFQWPPSSQDSEINEVIENFENFEKVVVKVLKKDTIEANKKQ